MRTIDGLYVDTRPGFEGKPDHENVVCTLWKYFGSEKGMKTRFVLLIFLLVMGLGFTGVVHAERLYVKDLDGWKDAFRETTELWTLVESIPESESLDSWTQMITVQIFPHMAHASPVEFVEKLRLGFVDACKNVVAHKVFWGDEGGYPTFVGNMYCTLNKSVNKGEITFVKVISSPNGLYVVQWAKRTREFNEDDLSGAISREEILTWNGFLRSVSLKSEAVVDDEDYNE